MFPLYIKGKGPPTFTTWSRGIRFVLSKLLHFDASMTRTQKAKVSSESAWLDNTDNASTTMFCLSLAVLGVAAYDALGQTSISIAVLFTTAIHGALGLAFSGAIARERLTAQTASSLLTGCWLVLWLNMVARIGFVADSGQATLLVAVLAAAGWCVHSQRQFWSAIGLALAAVIAIGFALDDFRRVYELSWAWPLGVLFGWRLLLFRVWTAKHWDNLHQQNEETCRTLKEMVSTVQANEERFRLLSENVPMGVFQTDEDGVVIFTNTAWRRITGTSFRDSVDKDWTHYIHVDERDQLRNAWHRAMEDGNDFERECRLVSVPGNERWIHLRSCPNHADSGTTYVGMAEEITQQKRAKEELLRHTAYLQEAREKETRDAERLKLLVTELDEARKFAEEGTRAKSEFLANMSHEIRTPMTAVLGYADLLIEQTGGTPALQEPLRTIKHNGEFLLELINDILDLSKIEAGKLELEQVRCSPRQIAMDVLALMQIRARQRGVALELKTLGPFPQSVESDPTRLRQILLNLVSNAIKFTQDGNITVSLKYEAPADSTGEIPGKIFLAVRDTGIGITEAQRAKLFLPFTQAEASTARQFGGTGLGLTICKRFAEMMGGEILVDSAPDCGSTFTIVLPVLAPELPIEQIEVYAPSPSTAAVAVTTPVVSTTEAKLPYRILVAEDGPDNQKLLQFILKKAGANVTLVENGQLAVEAVEAAIAAQQPYDVVLMDMSMPVLDGYGATRRLRDRGYVLPIIALTAHAMSGDREKCIAAGCTDYATKPLNREGLLRTIAGSLQNSPPPLASTVAP